MDHKKKNICLCRACISNSSQLVREKIQVPKTTDGHVFTDLKASFAFISHILIHVRSS